MTSKTLAILAGTAVVIGLGAYVVSSSRSGRVESALSGGTALIYPDLAGKGDGVTSIVVRAGAEENTVHKLEGKGWTIGSRDDYPADVEKVRTLVETLSQAKIAEIKTSKPDYYDRLGVQDADAKGSASTLVTLKAGEQVVASLIIGNAPATRGDNPMQGPLPGVFARKAGEAQAVLLDKAIEIPKGAPGWMKTDVLSIEGSRAQSVTLTQAPEAAVEGKVDAPPVPAKPEETLTLSKEKPDAENFEVTSVPEGRKLRAPSAPAPIATLLSYVTMDDAASIKNVDGLTPVSSGTFKTFDGLVVNTRLFEKDGKDWLTLAASYEAPAKPEVPADAAPKTDAGEVKPDAQPEAAEPKVDPKADQEKRHKETADKVQKEVADINARLSPWAFQLPEFKAKQFRTRVEDLLVPVVPVEPSLVPTPQSPLPPPPSQPLPFERGGAPVTPKPEPARPNAPKQDEPKP